MHREVDARPGPEAGSSTRARRPLGWFLSSRVARRVFLLFVLCAVLPLLLFAGLALRNVTEQLERQAEMGLHEECKALGMTVVERLGYLRDDLRLLFTSPPSTSPGEQALVPEILRDRLDARFDWVALGTADSRLIDGASAGIELPPLSPEARTHLAREPSLITFRRGAGRSSQVLLVVALPSAAEQRYAFGQVRSAYLWNADGVLRPDNDVIVLSDSGEIIFGTDTSPAFEESLLGALRSDPSSGHYEWRAGGASHIASYRTVFTSPQFFRSFVLAESRPRARVDAPVRAFKEIFVLFSVVTLLGAVLASLVQIRRSLVPIEQLEDAAARIRERDFSVRVDIKTKDEFRDLGRSFNGMAESLERHVGTMDTLYRIGVALTAEKDSHRLLETVGTGTLDVTQADLVLIHLVDDESRTRVVHVSSEVIDCDLEWVAGIDRAAGPFPDGTTPESTIAARAVTTGQTVVIHDMGTTVGFDQRLHEALVSMHGLRVRSVLCVPMRNHESETIGVLELLKTEAAVTGARRPFSAEELKVAESLASQAGVALTKNKLVDDFRDLFEALTELIATAIDEKSKYTGDHCRRVPLLTMMLAEEVCGASSGIFADFAFSADQLYELKVAALLHDCGKVVTPIHVVDKATKLETIFDRIALVSARFDVARRDVEIAHLRRALARRGAGESELTALEEELSMELASIERDRDFIRVCNVGGEHMDAADQARVRRIAEGRTWVDSEGHAQPLLTEDEVTNLCISRGTLTAEEREVINYHVVATIKMLEQLPYPKHLRRVPEIAGAHHERMDGNGYPLGLQRGQIALQGRILGIADVFEALTAKDRPYKPGKTLTETLTILGRMKEEGHVDPDLFQLLIESGAYKRYAREFLDPEQIDDVDLRAIPGYSAPEGSRRAG